MATTTISPSTVISQGFYGRKEILTKYTEITRANVVSFIDDCLPKYMFNKGQIDYLYKYYKGEQPIRWKTKQVRPEINNIVTINRANEIVSFKTGYFIGEPIQYVNKSVDATIGEKISKLNDYMSLVSKSAKDKQLVEWQEICGTSYRMVLPNGEMDEGDAPYKVITLDPRYTYVAYSLDVTKEPVAGVYVVPDNEGCWRWVVYTKTRVFEVYKDQIVDEQPYRLGIIPIIEYPANSARLGAFEIVMPILDTINVTQSDRLDALDQAINSMLVFYNCELGVDDDGNEITPQMVREAGALFLQTIGENKADLKEIVSNLDQANTQTLIDNLTKSYIEIVGMPTQSDGSTGDSSNNGAVIFKNGWQGAETRAKDKELSFMPPERTMLKLVLRICRELGELDLALKDIEIKFTRRQYDNLQVKSQVLTTMLNNEKISPIDAYVACGLFSDPEESCKRGLDWYEENKSKENENIANNRPVEQVANEPISEGETE